MAGLTWKDVFDIGLASYDRANESSNERYKMKYQKDIDEKNYNLALKKEERENLENRRAGYAFAEEQTKAALDEYKTRDEAMADLEADKDMIIDIYGEEVYNRMVSEYERGWDKKEADIAKAQKVSAYRKDWMGEGIKGTAEDIKALASGGASTFNNAITSSLNINPFGKNVSPNVQPNLGSIIGETVSSTGKDLLSLGTNNTLSSVVKQLLSIGVNPASIIQKIPQAISLFKQNQPQQNQLQQNQPQQVQPQNQMFQQ